MTKDECICQMAHRFYEIRTKNELPGDEDRDWRYGTAVFTFFADSQAPRTDSWQMKLEDYEPYLDIYEQYLGR